MSDSILALAPMEGVTDHVVRSVYAELGAVDYCVTEFIRVSSEILPARVLLRSCPELASRSRTGNGVPVHVQLLGGDAQRVAETARIAADLSAEVIDLNFGCPAPTVNRHDGGASLLRNPERVEQVTEAVRRAVPSAVAVSAKIRLGWSDPNDVTELARRAESGGASWLTVHARTRAQGYAPPVDWQRIGDARRAISIPVIANGDLDSPEAIAACQAITGCDRFMLGRGAIERPELFRMIRGTQSAWWPPHARLRVVQRYMELNLEHSSARDPESVTLGRIKHWVRAMGKREAALVAVFDKIKRVESTKVARVVLAEEVERGEEDEIVSNVA